MEEGKGALPLSQEVLSGPPCFLRSSRGVWVQLDPLLVPDLASGLWLKDFMCSLDPFHHPAKISVCLFLIPSPAAQASGVVVCSEV